MHVLQRKDVDMAVRARVLAAVLVALLLGPALRAQTTSPGGTSQRDAIPKTEQHETATSKTEALQSRLIMPFLEGTDVFISPDGRTGVEGTIFEANIFPHLIVWQNFSDQISVYDTEGGLRPVDDRLHRIRWSISGTPAVRLRMFNDVSDPVRTPSYMPRGNLQALWARNVSEVLGRADNRRKDASMRHPVLGLWEAHAIVGHHSNGQDGCFYKGQRRPPESTAEHELPCEPDIVPPNAEVAKELVNKRDGSFSTNYIRTGVNHRFNWVDADTLVAFREFSTGGEFEVHPAQWMDPHQVDLYGRHRINTYAAYAQRGTPHICPSRIEERGAVNYIFGAPSTVSNWALTGQVSCFPTPAGGWGVFVRYYRGQDYYNMSFLNQIQRWEVGATYNQDGFFRFRRVRAPQP
jgi:hypothetical protein